MLFPRLKTLPVALLCLFHLLCDTFSVLVLLPHPPEILSQHHLLPSSHLIPQESILVYTLGDSYHIIFNYQFLHLFPVVWVGTQRILDDKLPVWTVQFHMCDW